MKPRFILKESALSTNLINEGQTVKGISDDIIDYLSDEKGIETFLKKKYKNITSVNTEVVGNTRVIIQLNFSDGWAQMGPAGGLEMVIDTKAYRRRNSNQ